jgi:hypothetical protein
MIGSGAKGDAAAKADARTDLRVSFIVQSFPDGNVTTCSAPGLGYVKDCWWPTGLGQYVLNNQYSA